jgi:alkylation response protein AidB-like acyl-CoA dehydrogenase
VATNEDELIGATLRSFRQKSIEASWEKLDAPDAARFGALWGGLADIGVTLLGLPEEISGLALGPSARFDILHELGAGAPALGFALISHVTATSLLVEAAAHALSSRLTLALTERRFALCGSPLDLRPGRDFALMSNGRSTLTGARRVGLAHPDYLVVPALDGDRFRLCVVKADAPGVRFTSGVSSHGLRLVPFGELTLDHVTVTPEFVFEWPASPVPVREADGLVTALLAGITSELVARAARYALDRYQGGKMIHEHDAVQELVGPIELSRRCIRALSLAALNRGGPADAGASAFAVELVRRSGLDAVQTFGGYGYMEDYRVERYLRDANTLETSWIHASRRKRAIARERFAELRA